METGYLMEAGYVVVEVTGNYCIIKKFTEQAAAVHVHNPFGKDRHFFLAKLALEAI